MVIFYIFVSIFCMYWLLFILPTWWIKVVHVTTPLGLDKTILQLTDLHVERLRFSSKRLKKILRSHTFDYIVLTGDYLDNDSELPKLEPFLKELLDSNISIFAVLGNHDYLLQDIKKLKQLFRRYRIQLLENEIIKLDKFVLIGLDPYQESWESCYLPLSTVITSKDKVIVLCHDPNPLEFLPFRYDISLSGHFHGKQINIPYLFKLKRMGSLPEKGIYTGKHRLANGVVYISNGLGQTRYNIRFFVRSELTIHHL